VSGLPSALAPWAAPLAPFAPDLALSLGGLARRIAGALGPLPARPAAGGEPDGVGGLSRRGPYERLLLTEWLLADALPDEFIRRAAAGEHLFLEHARRARGAGRRAVALLDAGPDQLGTPRVAQLAILVVLAARAAVRRATFAWGVAQDPGRTLREGFDEAGVRAFLEARAAFPPATEALEAWRGALPAPAARDDLWAIGGPGMLRAAPPGAARLAVEEVVEPGPRRVRLALEAAGIAQRELVLDLPPDPICVRLLRDPFRTAVAAPVRGPARIHPELGILFSQNGRRLAVAAAEGDDALDVHVPSSPAERSGRVRRLAHARAAAGIGWVRGKGFAVALEPGAGLVLRSRRADRRADGVVKPGSGVPLPARREGLAPLAPAFEWPLGTRKLWLLDADGLLHVLPFPAGTSSIAASGVLAALRTPAWIAWISRREGAFELEARAMGIGREAVPLGEGMGRAFLSAPRGRLVCATQRAPGNWTVQAADPASRGRLLPLGASREVSVPAGFTVVGATLDSSWEPALVVLDRNRRLLQLLDGTRDHLLHRTPEPIAAAAVSHAERAVGYTTRAGAVRVFSLDHGALVLDLQPGALA
jgi:hypothetical protein